MELFRAFNPKTFVVLSWPRFVRIEVVIVPLTDWSIRSDTSSAGSPTVDMLSFVLPDTETTDWEFAAFQALRPLETEPVIEGMLETQTRNYM